jgi:hypothetical protein
MPKKLGDSIMGSAAKTCCFVTVSLVFVLSSTVSFAISDCLYAGVNFSDGAISCQSGNQYRCSDGDWVALDIPCDNPPPAPAVLNPAACACTDAEMSACDQAGQACCVALEGDRCIKKCCPLQVTRERE